MTLPTQGPGAKYTVLAELGSGGMAVVYLAVLRGQSDFTKLIVLKVLHPFLADNDSDKEVFLREARLAARLNHPNVVQTYEVVDDGGRPMLVMEYLEGKAFNFVQHQAWSMPRAAGLAIQLRVIADVLAGLHYAHELCDFDGTPLKIVHRDVSPHNVFVTFDGQIKILDFGIAKLVGSPHDTEIGVRKGKPRYMSREQALGEPLDRRCDIFAIGVMLWEAIARRRLWGRRSDLEIVNALSRSEPIQSPRTYDADLDPELERICMRALAHNQEERYADCQELRTELLNVMARLPEQVSNTDVGNILSEVFADFRDQQRQLIAKRVSAPPAESSSPSRSSRVSFPGRPEATNHTSSYGTDSVSTSVGFWKRSGRSVGIAVLVASVLIATFLLLTQQRQTSETSANKLSDPVADPKQPLSTPLRDEVVLKMQAEPANARLFFDGRRVPNNPEVLRVPRDGVAHVVQADADGYLPKTERVVLDASRDVSLVLERATQTPPQTPAPPKAQRPVPASEQTPKPEPPAADSAEPSRDFPALEPPNKPRRRLDTENPWLAPSATPN